ncbi:MAG: DNA internalization-related competence protein ComEC/Rec2 [Lachnospiraceae bacterium]|nr:DNA internalization-related competence protein ComEC/Rec2 [Lachnospiraceae bacterium]
MRNRYGKRRLQTGGGFDIRRPVCVFALLFVMILSVLMLLYDGIDSRQPSGKYDGRELVAEGTVKKIENKKDKSVIHLKVISKADKELSENILIYLSNEELNKAQVHIGQTVGIRGRMNLFKPAYNRGQFDMREYYLDKHYSYVCYDGHVEYKKGSYDPFKDALYRIRLRTESVFEHYYSERYSGIIKALVLAQRHDLEEDVREQYKNAGISHILALSGLHIVTMGFILFGGIRRMGVPDTAASLIATGCTVSYCIMTGMPASAVRAMIMFFVSMGAVLLGRTNDLRTSSAIAALAMLMINPSYLYEAGFQLSFAAVIGIGLVYPSVRAIVQYLFDRDRVRRLHRSDKRAVRAMMSLLRTLLFSLSLQITTVPLTMWYYYQLPAYGIMVNMLVIPLAGILLAGSFITGIVGNIALFAAAAGRATPVYTVADRLSRLSALVTSGILKMYDLVTDGANKLPGGIIVTGRPMLWQMTVYYLAVAFVVLTGYYLMRQERRLRRAAVRQWDHQKYSSPEGISSVRNRIVRYLRIRSAGLICVLCAGTAVLSVRIRPGYEISSLYAGQGQCMIIHGDNVPTVMFDCGSTDVREVGKYTVVPFLKYCGEGRIDTVFVSHLDTDHVSGLVEILNMEAPGITIGRIVIPDGDIQERSENHTALTEAARTRGIPVYTMTRGDEICYRRLRISCLAPDNGREKYEDLNEGSLVLGVQYNSHDNGNSFRALMTGDISSAVEDELISGGLDEYDWLQVAHHGSRSAANERFIQTVRPRVAVISAGIDNKYGHPHEETLKLLREAGDTVTCVTSEAGEVDTVVSGGRTEIRKFK